MQHKDVTSIHGVTLSALDWATVSSTDTEQSGQPFLLNSCVRSLAAAPGDCAAGGVLQAFHFVQF